MLVLVGLYELKFGEVEYSVLNDAKDLIKANSISEIKEFVDKYADEIGETDETETFIDFVVFDATDEEIDEINEIKETIWF